MHSVPQEICNYCAEEIGPGERSTSTGLPLHHECMLRIFAGSISHQLKMCHCFGGTWEDPPELTTRQAARLAAEHWLEKQLPKAGI